MGGHDAPNNLKDSSKSRTACSAVERVVVVAVRADGLFLSSFLVTVGLESLAETSFFLFVETGLDPIT
jgi:hypothetical protein